MSHPAQQFPPPPPPSAQPSPLTTIPAQAWARVLLIAAVFFGGALLAAGVTAAFGVTGVNAVPELAELDATVGDASSWLVLTFQLLAMGFMSPLSLGMEFAEFGGFSGGGSVFFVPWLVPVTGILAVALTQRHLGGNIRATHPGVRALLAATAGLAFALVVTVLAASIRFRTFEDFEAGSFWAHAASVPGFLVATLTVGTTAYLLMLPRRAPLVQRIVSAFSQVAEHIIGLALLAGLGALIWNTVQTDPAPVALVLAVLPNLSLMLVSLAHLIPGVVSGNEDVMGFSGGETFTMFQMPTGIWITAIVLVVLGLGVAAFRWSLRTRFHAHDATAWITLLVAYLLAGVIVTAANGVYLSMFMATEGLRASAHSAIWGFVMWTVIGAIVQVLAAYVLPSLVYRLPSGIVRILGIGLTLPPAFTTGAPTQSHETQPSEPQPLDHTMTMAAPENPQPTPGAASYDPGDAWNHQPSQQGPKKMTRTAKVAMLTIAGLAVIGIAGAVTFNVLERATFGPQHTAEAYLQAVIDGRAEEALAHIGPNVTDELRALATNEVYQAATNRPDRFELGEVQRDGDIATISATLYQSGKAYPVDLMLRKAGTQAVVFRDWAVESGDVAGRAIYTAGPSQLTVNEVEVDVSPATIGSETDANFATDYDDETVRQLAEESGQVLLPGTYVFTAPEGSKYLSSGSDLEVTITPGEVSATPIEFSQRYTEAFETDAIAIIEQRLESCLADKTIRIDDCEAASWEDTMWTAMSNMQRVWETPPVIELVPAGADTWYDTVDLTEYAGPVTARVTDGSINLTYQVRDDEDDDWMDRERVYDPFTVGFQPMEFPVTLEDDEIVVDFAALDEYNPAWLSPEFR